MSEYTKTKQQHSKSVGTVHPASADQEVQEQAALQQGTINRVLANPTTLSTTDIMYLQRSIGNRAVSQLLGRDRTDKPASPNNTSGLRVGPADDVYEREARQVANQVASSTSVQRSTASQSAPEVGGEGGAVSGELENQIRRAKHGGSPISNQIRRKVEKETGDNYKDVRVHQDKSAQSINDSIGARAATLGKDIFLGRNQSPHDIQLMAHELTHVTQQRGARGLSALSTAVPTIQRGPVDDDEKPTSLSDKEYPELAGELTSHPLPKFPTTPNHWPTMMSDPRFNQDDDYTSFALQQRGRDLNGEKDTDSDYYNYFPEHRPPEREIDTNPTRYHAEAERHLQDILPTETHGSDLMEFEHEQLREGLRHHIFVAQPFMAKAVKEKRESLGIAGDDPSDRTSNPINLVSRLLRPIHDEYIEADTNLKNTGSSVKNLGSKINSLDSFLNTLEQFQGVEQTDPDSVTIDAAA
jgi:hypothetical protein